VETSLLLHFRPDTVDMTAARDFRSTAETAPIGPIGGIALAWVSSDLNPAGVVGEAHLASAEKGRLTAEHYVANIIGLLQQVAAADLSGLAPINGPAA
jgi:creatinine amidohydrolase